MGKLYDALTFEEVSIIAPSPFGYKKGFYLQWTHETGALATSDIFPLKGYSKETLKAIYNQLLKVKMGQVCEDELFPSVHFALHHPLLSTTCLKKQRYQGLIQKHEDLNKACRFKTLKIKTVHFTDTSLIHLIETYHQTHTLRFDAQRHLLSQRFIDYLLKHPTHYEYIEEPQLWQPKAALLKIALDETLYIEKKIPNLPHLKALIYKPTLCGGLARIKHLKSPLPLILSSCYESSLGIARLIQLHQNLYLDDPWDIGLDTLPIAENKSYLNLNPPYLSPLLKNEL